MRISVGKREYIPLEMILACQSAEANPTGAAFWQDRPEGLSIPDSVKCTAKFERSNYCKGRHVPFSLQERAVLYSCQKRAGGVHPPLFSFRLTKVFPYIQFQTRVTT